MQSGATVFESGLGPDGEPGTGSTTIGFNDKGDKFYWVKGSTQDDQKEEIQVLHVEQSQDGSVKVKPSDATDASLAASSSSNSLYILRDPLTSQSYVLEAQYDKTAGHLSNALVEVENDKVKEGTEIAYLTKI